MKKQSEIVLNLNIALEEFSKIVIGYFVMKNKVFFVTEYDAEFEFVKAREIDIPFFVVSNFGIPISMGVYLPFPDNKTLFDMKQGIDLINWYSQNVSPLTTQ